MVVGDQRHAPGCFTPGKMATVLVIEEREWAQDRLGGEKLS
jgi:hypothetical protein